MKSLKESLFDIDTKINKTFTLGDIFKNTKYDLEYYNSRPYPIENEWSYTKIKKDTGISDSSHVRVIVEGLLKIIKNIKLDGDPEKMDKNWLKGEIVYNVQKYLLKSTLKRNIRHNFNGIYVYITFYTKNGIVMSYKTSFMNDEVTKIVMSVGDNITFIFEK